MEVSPPQGNPGGQSQVQVVVEDIAFNSASGGGGGGNLITVSPPQG